LHVDTPVAHEVDPVLQRFVGWQVFPAAQDEHVPALHTLSVPQGVPSPTAIPVSTQLTAGEHAIVPEWHALAGTHERPCEHAMQAPPLHTLSVPHGVPFGVLPDSIQTGAPVLHAVVPVRHALPATEQVDPAVHATQAPVELHTLSVPHDAPTGTFIPVSVHVGVAPEQLSVPV
jgi:hypothetical protein